MIYNHCAPCTRYLIQKPMKLIKCDNYRWLDRIGFQTGRWGNNNWYQSKFLRIVNVLCFCSSSLMIVMMIWSIVKRARSWLCDQNWTHAAITVYSDMATEQVRGQRRRRNRHFRHFNHLICLLRLLLRLWLSFSSFSRLKSTTSALHRTNLMN